MKKKQSFSKECFVGAYLSIKTTEGFKAIILKIGNTIFNINVKTLLQLLKQILIKIDWNKFFYVQIGIKTK